MFTTSCSKVIFCLFMKSWYCMSIFITKHSLAYWLLSFWNPLDHTIWIRSNNWNANKYLVYSKTLVVEVLLFFLDVLNMNFLFQRYMYQLYIKDYWHMNYFFGYVKYELFVWTIHVSIIYQRLLTYE